MGDLRFFRMLLLAFLVGWCAFARAEMGLQVSRLQGEPPSIEALLAGKLDNRFVAVGEGVLTPQPTVSGWYRVESKENWPADQSPMLVLRTWSSSRGPSWPAWPCSCPARA